MLAREDSIIDSVEDMPRGSLSDIANLDEALATIDNRYYEWYKSLSPLGQFLTFFANTLRMGYSVPLGLDTKRYVGALWAIAEECDIREQLATEREQLHNQRQVMLQLENDFSQLVKANGERIEKWKKHLEADTSIERPMTPKLREYYTEMIAHINNSSNRLIQAMKKVTTTAIDSEESLIFNDLQRHSSHLCYIQNRTHLRKQLDDAKEKRLQFERIYRDVMKNMDFLRNSDPLDTVHVASLPLQEFNEGKE